MLRSTPFVLILALTIATLLSTTAGAGTPAGSYRTENGSGNNLANPKLGMAGQPYSRVAKPNYADGVSKMQPGPSPRAISNAIFNDLGQNVFSENDISQWGWAWGQFIDHDMDLRNEANGPPAPIPFDKNDPLERFSDDVGTIAFNRTLPYPGTGRSKRDPRQQQNTITSFIDASQIFGSSDSRTRWLRQAGTPDLLLPGGYLPRANARGNVKAAPPMDLMGALPATPAKAVEAGDVRANENIALTGLTTLFARESNRIADSLPSSLSDDDRFQIARKVVGAEMQFITYTQFLPTLGVKLPAYSGYDPSVYPAISNEFATVGFRAHSMVHGEFEPTVPAGTYTAAQLATFQAGGIIVETNADSTVTLVIPLAVAFGNPDLLQAVGLGPALQSLDEHEYKNDETIDDSLRSVLFEIPKKGTNPAVCEEPAINPGCFTDIADLGADDIQRGRDQGMPFYNQMRIAYGLPPAKTFTDITGEATEELPAGMTCGSAATIQIASLTGVGGVPVQLGDADNAIAETRASTLAARLKCLYGSVNRIDAFVGMVSEPHIAGTEFGALQYAMWLKQFKALRDGDRFFYLNDPALKQIEARYGISYRLTLSQIVKLNTGEQLPANVFKAPLLP